MSIKVDTKEFNRPGGTPPLFWAAQKEMLLDAYHRGMRLGLVLGLSLGLVAAWAVWSARG